MKNKYLREFDTFWTVVFTDPISIRLTRIIAKHTNITPNQISLLSAFAGLTAAVMFFGENLILGAILWQLSYILDATDGKLARLLSKTCKKGEFVDMVSDSLRDIPCFIAIAVILSNNYGMFGALIMVIFLGVILFYACMTNFYFTLKSSMKKTQIRKRLDKTKSKGLFKFYYRIKVSFAKHRIIPYPTSTECIALIFVIGPITGKILEASIIACILMLLNAIVYSFKTYYFVEH